MAKPEAPEVADLLLEIGGRASLEGDNPYKAKAYIRAAESLRTLVTPLGEIIRRSQLRAILADGSLDYPDDNLATFDFVMASVHCGFRRDKAEQTARIIKAVSNPFTCILGHITGRLLRLRHRRR